MIDELPADFWEALFTGVDQDRQVGLVLESDDELVGAGRLVRYQHDWHTADLAITILDPWQGRGAGRLLAREILAVAEDVYTIDTTGLADNHAALLLLEGLGALTLECESGACKARVEVARRSVA